MASPAQIKEELPETLPEDFVEWDETSSSAGLVESGSGEPGPIGVVSNPATQAAEAQRAGTPSRNLPRGAQSISAPEGTGGAAGPQRAQSLSPASVSSGDNVGQLQAAAPAIDEVRFSAPPSNGAPPADPSTAFERTKAAKKKWPIIGGASAALVVILAAVMMAVFNRGRVPSEKSASAPAPTMSAIQQPEDAAPTRADSTRPVPASTAAAPTADKAQIISEAARRPLQNDAGPSREQAPRMDYQLHAPTRLHMKATPGEQAPPPPGGFAAAEINGLENRNAIGAVFGGPKPSRVQVLPQQIINVPSSIAMGLLIEKKPPVYPVIAREAQVSGTIELAAIISKTGNVEKLRVVSGPYMLRLSALNAVYSWRFKPYMLYNQPTAMETTINVHFTVR
jgi:TonB family protein